MDPVSQGAIGAAFAQASRRDKLVAAGWLGAAAGMAPDLDIFIRSATDPLLFLEFHRHFTHALIFIPIGAAIVAGALYGLYKNQLRIREAYLVCLLGYATHGLLDSCTSYGTQLFWPFTDYRVAWNNVSVVDPLFTLPLLGCVIWAARSGRRRIALFGLVWALFYLSLGVAQMWRATSAAETVAASRGHDPQRLTVKASFANLILWKSIYEHEGNYYIDAIRSAGSSSLCPGSRQPVLSVSRDLPFLTADSQQARDLERFRWFSDDYLIPTGEPGEVTDIRYSTVPNSTEPMWGITLYPGVDKSAHVEWWSRRRVTAAERSALTDLLMGRGCEAIR